ncbi:MAG: DUF192 domain-containing protein [Halobacteriales archaeon]
MRLHDPDAYNALRTHDGDLIADDVYLADGFVSRAVGLMFRGSVPDGYALVFEFGRERRVGLHTVFVRFPIDAVFLDADDRVVSVSRLRPWSGYASERAVSVVELPAGAADGVEEGDTLVLEPL